jgi:putative transposase
MPSLAARRSNAIAGPDVGRESPASEVLRQAFRMEVRRTQRRSDGTVSLEGRRFEIASQFSHLKHPRLRYARWDLANVDLVDARSGAVVCPLYPLDKIANASGERRLRKAALPTTAPPRDQIAPLLSKLMAEFAATGLPPPYVPDEEESSS